DSEATYVVTLHDITEYKQMKASAERNKNLARLGEAAAGINHEIKNLIYPIRYQIDRLGNLDIENVLEVRKELQRATSVIPEQVSALEKMLSNLKNLGRPLKLRIGIVDL